MSQHKLSFTSNARPWNEKLMLDDQDISSMVNVLKYEANPGGMPTVLLGLSPASAAIEVDSAVAEVTIIDSAEAVQVRQFLAEACDLCQQMLTLMTEEQLVEITKNRDTGRQIRLWLMHTDGPDAEMSVKTYREKMARVNDGMPLPEDVDDEGRFPKGK